MVRKIVSIIVMIVFFMQLSVCGVGINESNAARKTTLKKDKATLIIGKTYKIKFKNKKPRATYTYKLNNKKIATVSKTGKIRGIKKGNARIKVMQKLPKLKKRKVGIFKISVKERNQPEVSPGSEAQNYPADSPAPNREISKETPIPSPIDYPIVTPTQSPAIPPDYLREWDDITYKLNDKNPSVQFGFELDYEETFAYVYQKVLQLDYEGILYPSDVIATVYNQDKEIVFCCSIQEKMARGREMTENAPYQMQISASCCMEHDREKNANGIYTIRLELNGSSPNGTVRARLFNTHIDIFPELRLDQKEITGQTKTITGRITNFPREVESVILVEVSTGRILQSAPITGEITGGRISGVFSMNVDFSEWESGTAFRIETEDEHFGKQFTLGP